MTFFFFWFEWVEGLRGMGCRGVGIGGLGEGKRGGWRGLGLRVNENWNENMHKILQIIIELNQGNFLIN